MEALFVFATSLTAALFAGLLSPRTLRTFQHIIRPLTIANKRSFFKGAVSVLA
jgi:hypothetical protein